MERRSRPIALSAAICPKLKKASAIVAQVFHREFVDPLASALEGEDADLRAGLIAAHIIGLATMRVVFNSPTIKERERSAPTKSANRATMG